MPTNPARRSRGLALGVALALGGTLVAAPTFVTAPAAHATETSPYVVLPSVGTTSPNVGQFITVRLYNGLDHVVTNVEWLRDGVPIAGSGGPLDFSYQLSEADVTVGTRLVVRVTLRKVFTSETSVITSDPYWAKPFDLTSAPVLSATPLVGAPVTAITGAWAPLATTTTFQWLRDGVAIPGATEASYTPVAADALRQLSVTQTSAAPGYGWTSSTSANVTVVGSFETNGTPTITGTLESGSTLSVSVPAWTPAAAFSYSWQRDGVDILDATEPSYTLTGDDAGRTITATVTGTLTGYAPKSDVSAGASIKSDLTATPTPVVSGTPKAGSTLTVKPGTWGPGSVALTYQWLRDGAPISGATGPSYTLVAADAGKSITVTVTGTKNGYKTVKKTSTGTAVLRALTAAPTPKISGTPITGARLTATAGTWGPAPVAQAYQWKRNGASISGATGKTYVVTAADAGSKLTVSVTGSKTGYVSLTKTSAALSVGKLFTAAPTPTLGGTANPGATLTARTGTWSPSAATLKYQWKRGGVSISGATSSTYKLTSADAGKKITVAVTATRSGYQTTTRTSAAITGLYPLSGVTAPKISGTTKVGSTLKTTSGTWSAGSLSYSYQWKRNGVVIKGATTTSYKLTAADKGKTITVMVTAKRTGYVIASKPSAATARVQ